MGDCGAAKFWNECHWGHRRQRQKGHGSASPLTDLAFGWVREVCRLKSGDISTEVISPAFSREKEVL
jgi:hypothetical protein